MGAPTEPTAGQAEPAGPWPCVPPGEEGCACLFRGPLSVNRHFSLSRCALCPSFPFPQCELGVWWGEAWGGRWEKTYLLG